MDQLTTKRSHYGFIAILSMLISACSTTTQITEIADLTTLPQDPTEYTQPLSLDDFSNQVVFNEQFDQTFFRPWDIQSMSFTLEEATWGREYLEKETYGENHKLRTQDWYLQQIAHSNFAEYDTLKRYAITTKNTNLRVFPTKSVVFYNPAQAGEGFPFDYNQNSQLKLNTPLFVSHYSLDKAWIYVEANSLFGWVPVNDMAFVNEEQRNAFKTGSYYVAIEDNFPLFNEQQNFVDYIKLGTIFPQQEGRYLTFTSQAENTAKLSPLQIHSHSVAQKPLAFSKSNLNKISSELIGEEYGWGGMLGHRDCSAFTKDFFTPFGIYLKRNTSKQLEQGQYVDLSTLSQSDKKAHIIENGVPFLTLVYLRGHIMLYVGERAGEPLMFHNIWGLTTLEKSGDFGRFIIGRAVITTLEPGKELPNVVAEKSLINRVEGMVILTTPNQ